jgi:uncharacterized protein
LRFVFDTNVIISALLLAHSTPHQAFLQALERGKVLLSDAVLAELHEVLARKRLRRYIDEKDIHAFLAALTHEAEWIDVSVEIKACRDPRDNKFLELAVSGRATHLVTGDSDLLTLNPFQGITILSPHALLEIS